MIPFLKSIFQDKLEVLGETLEHVLVPPKEAILLRDLLVESGKLKQELILYSHHLGSINDDLRPVASLWSMQYLWALLPPVTAAATVYDHVFPVQPHQIWVSLNKLGCPYKFYILDIGSAQKSSAFFRYDSLLWEHLVPLFESLSTLTGLPKKILWGNTVRYLDMLFENALELTEWDPKVISDREMLLHLPHWKNSLSYEVTPRLNPLYTQKRMATYEENGMISRHLHSQCCLAYKLPTRNYCQGCPIDKKCQALKP